MGPALRPRHRLGHPTALYRSQVPQQPIQSMLPIHLPFREVRSTIWHSPHHHGLLLNAGEWLQPQYRWRRRRARYDANHPRKMRRCSRWQLQGSSQSFYNITLGVRSSLTQTTPGFQYPYCHQILCRYLGRQ